MRGSLRNGDRLYGSGWNRGLFCLGRGFFFLYYLEVDFEGRIWERGVLSFGVFFGVVGRLDGRGLIDLLINLVLFFCSCGFLR